MLSKYEEELLMSIYDYNRVILWVLDEKGKVNKVFSDFNISNECKKLYKHMEELCLKSKQSKNSFFQVNHEVYYKTDFERNGVKYFIVGGPIFCSNIREETSMFSYSFYKFLEEKELNKFIKFLPFISWLKLVSCFKITKLILLGENNMVEHRERIYTKPYKITTNQSMDFIDELYDNSLEQSQSPYKEEVALLECVKNGDLHGLLATYKSLPEVKYGNMSKNPLKQLFYGCIANVTLTTRYAIDGGLDEATAFTLSDFYIRKLTASTTTLELNKVNEEMAIDFTNRVYAIKKEKEKISEKKDNHTYEVLKAMDFINKNIYEKITLDTIGKEVNLNSKYFSKKFKDEVGTNFHKYVLEKKVEKAKELLTSENLPYSKISNRLNFNSQSHFISVFKKEVGLTPKEYRDNQKT